MRRVGVLTISDRGARGEIDDRSGPLAATLVGETTGWLVEQRAIVPDEFEAITRALIAWCEGGLDLILTSGGTGFAPRDITPEATRAVIDREAPGLAETLRAESLKVTRHAMLSRAVAGMRGRTLIINLPGNPKAVREGLEVLMPVLPHALDLLTERPESGQSHRSL
ncbi:MAG: MogA/MoaB family molybdenum cofactor biosynthesis protein [Candidatus Promineofilum sp.]|nr:MogA/MoaB family molybdenum cofactor biosynthesis protein [Promineifilum sp.]MBP9657405.1 MogA/MoaB family molybdenum cofactor biosynthesis protein [Promineifilum sp.]